MASKNPETDMYKLDWFPRNCCPEVRMQDTSTDGRKEEYACAFSGKEMVPMRSRRTEISENEGHTKDTLVRITKRRGKRR